MGSAVNSLLGTSGGKVSAPASIKTYGKATSALIGPAPAAPKAAAPKPTHYLKDAAQLAENAYSHVVAPTAHTANDFVGAAAKQLITGFKNQDQSVIGTPKANTSVARGVLESIPLTESGAAGGSKADTEGPNKTSTGPSNVSLALQSAVPAVLKGASKVVAPVVRHVADLLASKASGGAETAVSKEVLPSAAKILEEAPVASTASKTAAPGRVAFDYNPDEKVPHEIVPADQLHPGARNVFGETLPVQAGDVNGAPLARDSTASVYHNLAAQTEKLASGLTPENVKLIDKIEIPTPKDGVTITASRASDQIDRVAKTIKDPQQQDLFRQVVSSMKQGKDTRYLSDTAGLGRDMGYIHNHLTHVYETNPAEGDFTPDNPTPGYTKSRVIATKAEAENLSKLTDENGKPLYPNLKPADINAVEAHSLSMHAAAYEHGDEAFRGAISSAHPGASVQGGVNGGYKIKLPGGTDISDTYNKRLSPTRTNFPYGVRTTEGNVLPIKDGNVVKALKANPGSKLVNAATGENLHSNAIARIVRSTKTNPLGAYDKANGAVKTAVLNGGLFHSATTAGSVGGQQLVRLAAHPLQTGGVIADNARLFAGTISKAAHASNMARFEQAGITDFSRKVGTTLGVGDGLGTDVSKTRIPLLHEIHDMVFNRQIPEAKLMIMKQSMETKFPGMDYAHPTPEQVAFGRSVALGVNKLGGINRAIEGSITPRTAKILGRVVLAPDYTEGKFRTITSALALAKNGPEQRIARQMVIGKSVLFAIPGLTALTVAGKINWNDPKDVAKNIGDQLLDPSIPLGYNSKGTATNPNGVPQSVHLPTTFVSEIGKIIKPMLEPMDTFNGDPLSGAKSYATNRIAALPAVAARLIQNKDFYGNPIITGNPGQSALNIGDQFAPIPAAQGIKQASGQQGLEATILNTLGGRVSSDTASPAAVHSTGISEYYNTLHPVQNQKTALLKQINKLATTGQPNKAARLAAEWNASLPSKFSSLTSKYPAYKAIMNKDSNFTSLRISPKASAINQRKIDSAKSLKVLSTFQ